MNPSAPKSLGAQVEASRIKRGRTGWLVALLLAPPSAGSILRRAASTLAIRAQTSARVLTPRSSALLRLGSFPSRPGNARPFNHPWVLINSISFDHPYIRCTPMVGGWVGDGGGQSV